MSFVKEAIAGSIDLWDGYLCHPFINDIRDNCMDQAMFEHYLIQDTLYLNAYAKVFALGLYKSTTMAEMRLFYDLLSGVIQGESMTRVDLLEEMQHDMQDVEKTGSRKENEAYINFMMNTAIHEGVVEILFATLPCMLSYAYIGQKLVEENTKILSENALGSWIEEYANESYSKKCEEWSNVADYLCKDYDEKQKAHLKDLFREASVHEMHFWDMSYNYKKEEQ